MILPHSINEITQMAIINRKELALISIFSLGLCLSMQLSANEVEVLDVKANQQPDKTWRFRVTLKHVDEGWDHYANEWQIIAPDNKILATRTLYHPHVREQPFTRSLDGVKIPEKIKSVRVIAKDTVHGLSHSAMKIELATGKAEKIRLALKQAQHPGKSIKFKKKD